MSEQPTSVLVEVAPAAPERDPADPVEVVLVEEDLLIEDISIDGMCGVY